MEMVIDEYIVGKLKSGKDFRISTFPCSGEVCGPTSDAFVDAPISMTLDGQKYYYHFDGLGSVTEVIDSNEDVVNTYGYSPFGEFIVKQEQIYNPYQYTGRRYDEESGLYYYRSRMYSPEMSRFTSNDPAGMVDGANMYAYVGNNPTNARDPSGESYVPGLINPYTNILFYGNRYTTPSYGGVGGLRYRGAMDYDVGQHLPKYIREAPYPSDPQDSLIRRELIYTFTTCMGICGRIGCWALMQILTSGLDFGYGFIVNFIIKEAIKYIPSRICAEKGCAGLCDVLTTPSPSYAGSGNYPGTPPDPDFGVGPR